jgi:uncharacterized protein (DUF2236 family)
MLMNGLALAPAGANVVMQLSRLPVGRGVAESRVTSGALTRRPIKRTRTTLGYIAVALLGSDEDRAQIRREVNRQHREVRSRDHDDVAYDAFDVDLQLWVAACMYRGALDAVRFIHGSLSDELLDELYEHCARFATTLQVPPDQWPRSREAFEEYWASTVVFVEMDDVTRTYLRGIAALTFLPRPLRVGVGSLHEFLTAGFLEEPFRTELGLTWDEGRQRRFAALLRGAVALHRRMPRGVREFPLNVVWWDTRRRLRSGRSFV